MLEKPVIFTAHARYQLQERGLYEKEVVQALAHSHLVVIQKDGRSRALCSTIRGKKKYLWVIVYEEYPNARKIITVFLTSKIKKYLNL